MRITVIGCGYLGTTPVEVGHGSGDGGYHLGSGFAHLYRADDHPRAEGLGEDQKVSGLCALIPNDSVRMNDAGDGKPVNRVHPGRARRGDAGNRGETDVPRFRRHDFATRVWKT